VKFVPVKNQITKSENVKGPDIYIPPLTGKPEQQRFTMRKWRTDQH